MRDKYPAAPRLFDRLKLQVTAIGAALAASAWVLLAIALVPFGLFMRAGRMLLHGPHSDAALKPE